MGSNIKHSMREKYIYIYITLFYTWERQRGRQSEPTGDIWQGNNQTKRTKELSRQTKRMMYGRGGGHKSKPNTYKAERCGKKKRNTNSHMKWDAQTQLLPQDIDTDMYEKHSQEMNREIRRKGEKEIKEGRTNPPHQTQTKRQTERDVWEPLLTLTLAAEYTPPTRSSNDLKVGVSFNCPNLAPMPPKSEDVFSPTALMAPAVFWYLPREEEQH